MANKSPWWLFFQWWVAIFTALLFVMAALQAWAFIQSQRAFVAPAGASFARQLVVGINPLPMYLDIRNSGRITAFIDELSVVIAHELHSQPAYGKGQKIAFPPIVAGATSRRILNFETGWGEATTNAVTSGTMKFYIYGVIKYSDSFSLFGPMETGFCFVYVPTIGGGAPVFQNCIERPYTYTK